MSLLLQGNQRKTDIIEEQEQEEYKCLLILLANKLEYELRPLRSQLRKFTHYLIVFKYIGNDGISGELKEYSYVMGPKMKNVQFPPYKCPTSRISFPRSPIHKALLFYEEKNTVILPGTVKWGPCESHLCTSPHSDVTDMVKAAAGPCNDFYKSSVENDKDKQDFSNMDSFYFGCLFPCKRGNALKVFYESGSVMNIFL